MKRLIFIYALFLASLIFIFQWLDYQLFAKSIAMEIYLGITALLFAVLGLWAGTKFSALKRKEVPAAGSGPASAKSVSALLSQREFEVLQLMEQGLSNKEIADLLFISAHTVKSHSSNIFSKLDVKRRTQAVAEARRMQLI